MNEAIELMVNYAGAPVNVSVLIEENVVGTIYPIELDGQYAFTLYMNEDDEWNLLKESNGTIPHVDQSLQKEIIRKLKVKLRDAA